MITELKIERTVDYYGMEPPGLNNHVSGRVLNQLKLTLSYNSVENFLELLLCLSIVRTKERTQKYSTTAAQSLHDFLRMKSLSNSWSAAVDL